MNPFLKASLPAVVAGGTASMATPRRLSMSDRWANFSPSSLLLFLEGISGEIYVPGSLRSLFISAVPVCWNWGLATTGVYGPHPALLVLPGGVVDALKPDS